MNQLEIKDELKSLKNRIGYLESFLNFYKPTEPKQEEDIYLQATKLMHELQVPPNLLGYYYIRTAIVLIYEDMSMLHRMTKELYPKIAKENGKKAQQVERAIRHAIETVWDKESIKDMNYVFGARVNDYKPNNSEFLAAIVDYLRVSNGVQA